jgi:hypothetical protein
LNKIVPFSCINSSIFGKAASWCFGGPGKRIEYTGRWQPGL